MSMAVRASGFSLAYSTATALGGFTPYVATWLIARTHDDYAYNARRSAEAAGLDADSVYLVSLPAGQQRTTRRCPWHSV